MAVGMMMYRLLFGLALLGTPLAALADPITFVALVAPYIGGTLAAFIASNALTLVTIGVTLYGTADARRKQRAAQARSKAAYNAGLEDRSITALQSDPPWDVVYGRAIKGGYVLGIFASDKTGTRTDGTTYIKPDGYKHMVIALAGHECEAINEIYIDGVAVGPLSGEGWATTGEFASARTVGREITLAPGASSAVQPAPVTVMSAWDGALSVTSGEYVNMVPGSYTLTSGNTVINNTSGHWLTVTFTMSVAEGAVRIQKHLGTSTQTVDTVLNGLVPSEWTANDRLRGITYVVVTLDLEETRFQGGPPGMTFDVSGKKVYDPRTGLTVFSSNPALCIRDFLTSEWGYNCVAADIDDTYTIAAANACDVAISLTIGGTTTTGQKTFTCNGTFNTLGGKEAVLNDLSECMAGYTHYGAQWLIQAGSWTVPVMSLVDDDLHGQIELVQGGAGMDETFNTVRGSYVPAGGWVPADIDVYENSTFVAADGEHLYTDITLPFTDNKARAKNLARIFVERNRDSLVIRYPAKLRAWPLQVGDRVSVTNAEHGFSNKTFRVTDWDFSLTGAVVLTMQEDAASIYDLADAATSDPAGNSDLPNPWVVAPISGLAASSGTAEQLRMADGSILPRVRVSWSAVTGAYVADGGSVEIVWRRQLADSTNAWNTVQVAGSDTQTFLTGVIAGDSITIGARVVNSLGAKSSYVYIQHAVAGNITVPSNVSGLSGTVANGTIRWTWNRPTNADYARTEVRLGGASWAAAAVPPVFTGAANGFSMAVASIGVYTVWAKNYNRTGNESAVAASSSVTVTPGDMPGTDPKDLTAPPTPTGLAVTAGMSYIYVECSNPTYTEGHGHDETVVYGAKWPSGAAPTFGAASELFRYRGTFGAYPTDTGTRWCIWIKWQSVDGVKSVSPAGGANGVQATTGKIGTTDLGPLIVEAGNLANSAVTGPKIATGAIDATKFVSSVEPIAIVSSVPGTLSTKTIFNTTDGKLYRWNGTAYVATVPAVDVSGTLTDTQIASIAAAKLTGQITTTQISDNAISTPKIAAGAVTTNAIAANAITANEIASNAITTVKLAANAVTAAKIAANTITSNEIAANTITAGELAAASVTATKIAANAIAVGTAAIQNGAIVNAMIANATIDDAKIANLSADKLTAGYMQVGSYIRSTGWVAGSSGWSILASGAAEFNTVTVRGGVYATFGAIGNLTINNALTVDSSGHIKGGQTGYNTGTGFFLGYSSGYKFSIGNPSGYYMLWTGTDLIVNAKSLGLPAFSASIGGGNINVAVGNGQKSYGFRTTTPSGGSPPYSYSWSIISQLCDGAGYVYLASGSSTATVGISGYNNNAINDATVQCMVTDSIGRVASAYISVSATHGTPA